ncbi:MAG: energy transducer TonB [Halioglobus sp.]
MGYLVTAKTDNQRLRYALVIALILHALVVANISFNLSGSNYNAPQIEVTLATRPSTSAAEDAQLIAQANQRGSGNEADLTALSSEVMAASSVAPRPTEQESNDSTDLANSNDPLVTTTGRTRNRAQTEVELQRKRALLEGISPEVDALSEQLASLEATLDEQTQAYSNRPRVRRLTSASARQAADAAYLLDWRQRLEAVGNTYYPEASLRYGIYGELRLLVIIRKDGSLEDVSVLSSSGYAVLDEAAIKIVRLAAPYAPFPPELSATTDKLEIIRTWQFQENELSSD